MKATAPKDGRSVTDAKGKPVGMLLDLKTYERLPEAHFPSHAFRARPKSGDESPRSKVAGRRAKAATTFLEPLSDATGVPPT